MIAEKPLLKATFVLHRKAEKKRKNCRRKPKQRNFFVKSGRDGNPGPDGYSDTNSTNPSILERVRDLIAGRCQDYKEKTRVQIVLVFAHLCLDINAE